MMKTENEYQYIPKEEEKNDNIKKGNILLNLELNVIEESQENIKNKEEEHLSEEESLGYNSNYKALQNNGTSKENINLKDKVSKRKASTLSTTISQTDTYEINSFLPPNNLKSQNCERKTSYTQPSLVFFGRERLNSTPITSYYEGLDSYLSGLHPEKSEYKKSNNYIEKEIFFKQKNFSFKDNKFKSFDLTEQKKFSSNQILKNIDENYKITTNNNLTSSLTVENNMPKNVNNNPNILTPLTPKFNNNCIYGKFDMPMYYIGYYNIDGKYYLILFFYFSIKWNANNAK